jgi:hypothetical protein
MTNLVLFVFMMGSDFPICTAPSFQDYPVVKQVDDLYYVFWADQRLFSSTQKYAVYAARVTADGHVIDPDGKLIFCDSAASRFDVAFGVSSFLGVCRNGC